MDIVFCVVQKVPKPFKGPVTQAPITRIKMKTIKMHALDWLNERGRILRRAFQPIEGVHFYRYRFRSRYRAFVTGP